MDEAVDGGDGDGALWGCGVPTAPQGVGEDAFPGAEWLVGGDGEAARLTSRAISSKRTELSAWPFCA